VIAALHFCDGRCTGIAFPQGERGPVTLAELVGYDMLSITDRMILDKLAARVDAMARKLAEAPDAAR
jgi:hypothetical protein